MFCSDDAIKCRADLVGAAFDKVMALLTTHVNFLASCKISSGYERAPIGLYFFNRT